MSNEWDLPELPEDVELTPIAYGRHRIGKEERQVRYVERTTRLVYTPEGKTRQSRQSEKPPQARK